MSLARRSIAVLKRPYWDRPDTTWLVRRWPDLTGLILATVFFWFSLTPSLVPRSWFWQGVIGGLSAGIGYAIGVLVSSLVRLLRRDGYQRIRPYAWQVYYVVAIGLSVYFLTVSAGQQRELRRLFDLPPDVVWHRTFIVFVALAVLAVLVGSARGIRLAARSLTSLLARLLPRSLALVLGYAVVGCLVFGLLYGIVYERFVIATADRIAAASDLGTKPGLKRPASRFVSGGPGSLIAWRSLGAQGRSFTATAPSRAALERFPAGKRPVKDPIRLYVSSTRSTDYAAAADRAVAELKRTGAFSRSVVLVVGATGTGWIDPDVIEPLEYMYGGDTAIVGIQYSYLPSWVSFLVDLDRASNATSELFASVRSAVSSQPAGSRPKLVVAGESLGSYGIESTFGSLSRLTSSTDGALLLGPPHANPIRTRVTRDRDPGSPEWRPVYREGRTVRFAQRPGDLFSPSLSTWSAPRVAYLQNASDPVVWWTPDLLLERPGWAARPHGPDVSPDVEWFPFVTFWQVTADLFVGTGWPHSHGHVYGTGAVEGWSAVVPPPGWSRSETVRLKSFVDALPVPY